jgi:hypothetical protein
MSLGYCSSNKPIKTNTDCKEKFSLVCAATAWPGNHNICGRFWTQSKVFSWVSVIFTKVKLISKCLLGVFHSPKKVIQNNSILGTIVVKSTFYVHFMGELKIPSRHFEIS